MGSLRSHLSDGSLHVPYHFLEVQCSGRAISSDHNIPPACRYREARGTTQSPSCPISSHRATGTQRNYQPHARGAVVFMKIQGEPFSPDPASPSQHSPERAASAQGLLPPHGSRTQADSRARPLARLFFRIDRPARVRMRARKPCFRLRRRLLGWKVRLVIGLPSLSRLTSAEVGPSRNTRVVENVWQEYSRAMFLHVNRLCPETSSRAGQSFLDSPHLRLLRIGRS